MVGRKMDSLQLKNTKSKYFQNSKKEKIGKGESRNFDIYSFELMGLISKSRES